MKRFGTHVAAGLVLTLVFAISAAAASDPWEFEVSPYLWAMGIDGDLKAGRVDYDASASFSDIIDQTKYGAQFLLEANRGS